MTSEDLRAYMRDYMRAYRAGRPTPRRDPEVSPPGHCVRCGLADQGRDLCRWCVFEITGVAA